MKLLENALLRIRLLGVGRIMLVLGADFGRSCAPLGPAAFWRGLLINPPMIGMGFYYFFVGAAVNE